MVALLGRGPTLQSPTRLGYGIDRSHPLARGLVFFPMFGVGGHPQDILNGYAPTASGAGLKIGPAGGSFASGSSNNGWFEWSGNWVGALLSSRTELSFAVRFTQRGSTLNIQGSMMSICAANGSGYNILGNTNTRYGGYINGSGTGWTFSALNSLVNGGTYTFVFSGGATNSRAMAFYETAMIEDVSLAALGTLNASLFRIRVGDERGTATGGTATGSFSPLGEVHYAAIWNRRLSNPEMLALGLNPFAFVRNGTSQLVPPSSPASLLRGWGIPLAA